MSLLLLAAATTLGAVSPWLMVVAAPHGRWAGAAGQITPEMMLGLLMLALGPWALLAATWKRP